MSQNVVRLIGVLANDSSSSIVSDRKDFFFFKFIFSLITNFSKALTKRVKNVCWKKKLWFLTPFIKLRKLDNNKLKG